MTTDGTDPIPGNYEQWRYCIEHWCGIPLTAEFIEQRLQALNNPKDHHTQRLRECYGENHLQALIGWFEQAGKQS